MKNLLIYQNPKGFDPESETLIKIQIDNSLELGWKKEDILLITNFAYSHNGVNSIVVEKGFCDFNIYSTKITTIIHLFDIGFFKNDLYWSHDLDAYQLEPITEKELSLENAVAGFCDYQRTPQWQMGSFFFRKSAEWIFREIVQRLTPTMRPQRGVYFDEAIMMELTTNNVNDINSKIKRLNGRYDFGMRRVDYCWEKAVKPLKVLHFHPHNPKINTLAIAMYGKNSIHTPLMNERLIKIFNQYSYQ